MNTKINELEDQLHKKVLEEQLLKSENLMLMKELERLRKKKQRNNQYATKDEQEKRMKEMK